MSRQKEIQQEIQDLEDRVQRTCLSIKTKAELIENIVQQTLRSLSIKEQVVRNPIPMVALAAAAGVVASTIGTTPVWREFFLREVQNLLIKART